MQSSEQPLSLDLKALTEVLIRHFEIHEGTYQLGIAFKIGVGGFAMDGGPTSAPLPGAIVGVEAVNLTKIPDGLNVPDAVNAAEINPIPKGKPRAKKSARA